MKDRLKFLGVLALTVVLLYLVFRRVGFAELLDTISQADLTWVLISLSLSPFIIFTGVIKWKILLESQGVSVPLWRLYALYLVGRFFSNFLPSNVGGDVVRGYELGNYTKDGAAAMASVFMERFTGFVMLVVMACISFFFQIGMVKDIRLTLAMGLAVGALLGILWLILDARPLNLVARWVKIPVVQKYIPKLRKFHASINAYRSRKRALVLSLLWSFVFMVLAITNVYASSRAFYSPISYLDIVVIVPVILVVAMVPLTFNGLGIQEWAYVFLFSLVGLPASVGLSAIILIRGKELLLTISGGLLYPVVKLSKPSEIATESPDKLL